MDQTVTFLHSGDWQLGMMRRILGAEAQARYGQARLEAIERIGAVAGERGAAFVVVAGDVFDANQVDRQVVLRACDALRAVDCPVLLLPGNHDALEPGSVWASRTLRSQLPSHVEVLTDSEPIRPCQGVQVIGVPWRTRRPAHDPVGAGLELEPTDELRVLVGHGQVDTFKPEPEQAIDAVRLAPLERALSEGRLHYVALGDRHSRTSVGESGRVWYAGTPEPTRPEEEAPGDVLAVTLSRAECVVDPVRVGTWTMCARAFELDDDADLDPVEAWLAGLPDKARTVVRLGVRGTLTVAGLTRLELLVEAQREVFAAVQRWRSHWDVGVLPDGDEWDDLGTSGPVREALDELRLATGSGDREAADALTLLHRIVRGAA